MRPAVLLKGATGSGKTTALLARCRQLLDSGVRSDQILVLSMHAAESRLWRRQIRPPAMGPLAVLTAAAFLRREVERHWPRIEARLPGGRLPLEPLFLPPDLARHQVETLIRCLGGLSGFRSSPQRLAAQLTGNLAAVAGAYAVAPAALAARLAVARGGVAQVTDRLAATLTGYQQRLLAARVLDAYLCQHVFAHCLRDDPDYQRDLAARVRHLLVDDLDETPPLLQDVIAALLDTTETAMLTFGSDGGHRASLGADPEGALARLSARLATTELSGSHTCSPAAFAFGQRLYDAAVQLCQAVGGTAPPLATSPAPPAGQMPVQTLQAELRSAMLAGVAERVRGWLDAGVPAEQIAVLAPYVDAALLSALHAALAPGGAEITILGTAGRLQESPLAAAFSFLLGLAHPAWQRPPGRGEAAAALGLLLPTDSVRAAWLAEHLVAGGSLTEPLPAVLQERLGFAAARAAHDLGAWLAAYQQQEPWPPDAFCHKLFAERIVPLGLAAASAHLCRQILDLAAAACRLSAQQALAAVPAIAAGQELVDLLRGGTTAVWTEAAARQPGAVLVGTPRAFLSGRHSARFQVWVDAAAPGWQQGDATEVVVPRTFSARWPADRRWTDADQLSDRWLAGARTVRALARRCGEGIVLGISSVSSLGYEQDGPLPELCARAGGVNA